MRKILVCGSRDFDNEILINNVLLEQWWIEEFELIHGDAEGADEIAKKVCINNGIPQTPYPADWEKYGRRAGVIRNSEMIAQKPDIVLAFFHLKRTKGTSDTIAKARKKNIQVIEYGLN